MSTQNDLVNNEEINIMNVEINPQEWNIRTIPTKQIYKQSTFSNLSFLLDYTTKTIEKTIYLNNECETVKLFSKEYIEKHRQKYSFIHIRLV